MPTFKGMGMPENLMQNKYEDELHRSSTYDLGPSGFNNEILGSEPFEAKGFSTQDAKIPKFEDATTVAKGAAAAKLGFNPYLAAGMVGLELIKGEKRRREKLREREFRAKQEAKSSVDRALSSLTQIGKAMKL